MHIYFIKYDSKFNPINKKKKLDSKHLKEAFNKKVMKLNKFQYMIRNFKNKKSLKRKSKVDKARPSIRRMPWQARHYNWGMVVP